MYVRDQSDLSVLRYILVDNPDYIDEKCSHFNKLERTFVRLDSFDIEQPFGGIGPLYDPNMIVIPDTTISVRITFPLTYPADVIMISQTSHGFSLVELIYSIKMLYHYIYQEEERTSTPQSYHLKKDCESCQNSEINCIKDYSPDSKDECSICYNGYKLSKKDAGQLSCNHFFHRRCILKWLKTSSSATCPLCRRNVIDCAECNGTRYVYYDYNGVVIPLEHRGSILNRNTTDGIYGIYGHDLEDLVIDDIHYNRLEKLLTIFIES